MPPQPTSHNKKVEALLEALFNTASGRRFLRLNSSNTPDSSQKFYAIRAINGSVIFDSKTEVDSDGDSPKEDDTIEQGTTIFGDFKKIDIKSGTAYAYYRK